MIRRHGIRFHVGASAIAAAVVLLGACGPQGEDGAPALASSTSALTQDHVVATGQACVPTGKHAEHGAVGIGCTTCHQCAGTLSFDPALAGATATFDATTKTCSNVKCHSVPAGTYTYYTYDYGLDAMVPTSVPYGGAGGGGGANWYAAPGAGGCSACHDYTPTYNGQRYTWHSGQHALTISNGNTCQLCHPDVSGAYVYGGSPSYVGTSGGLIVSCPAGTYCGAPGTITTPSMHGNGVVDVTPAWKTACFGCH